MESSNEWKYRLYSIKRCGNAVYPPVPPLVRNVALLYKPLRRFFVQNLTKLTFAAVVVLAVFAASCSAPAPVAQTVAAANCSGLPGADQLKMLLKGAASTAAPLGDAGGLFH